MKVILDRQIRVTTMSNVLEKDKLVKDLKDNYIDINDTTIALWKYNKKLKNEQVFNSYMVIDNIIMFIDLESRNYLAFRDGEAYDHKIFNEVTKWIRMKYKDEKTRLLNSMKSFRSKLLGNKLGYEYYIGVYSDMFSVILNGKEHLIHTWNPKHNKSIIKVDENFSFFLKVCKLII